MIVPDRKKAAMVIVSRMGAPHEHRYADGGHAEMGPDGNDMGGDDLVSLAGDFLDAVKSDDAGATADAFRAMFAALESEPHEEAGEEG